MAVGLVMSDRHINVMPMKFLLTYLFAEYKKRMFLTLRHVAFLVIVVGLLFFFAAIWPSTNFAYTATFQHANYDVRVNGPLTRADVQHIVETIKPVGGRYVGLNAGFADKLFVGDRMYKGVSNVYFSPDEYGGIPATYFSNGLLLQGSMGERDSWGIDYMTAKKLGVRLGERIYFHQSVSDKNGTIAHIESAGTISAIYAPTNEVNGIISPMTKDASSKLGREGVVYTDVFINAPRITPDELAQRLAKTPEAKGWLVEPVPEAYARGKAAVDQMLSRNIRYGTIWAALLVYAIFILREQFNKMERRKKNIAILFSLGLSEGRLLRMLVTEQAAMNLATAILGLWFGKYILQDTLGLYVPRETSAFLFGFFSLIILIIMALSVAQTLYRLRKIDVARLLASE